MKDLCALSIAIAVSAKKALECKHRYVIWVISANNFFVSMCCICENTVKRDIWNSYSNRRYLVWLKPSSKHYIYKMLGLEKREPDK